MYDTVERDAIATGFRRLRPVIHAWLARDLIGPPGEYTRAYADLTLAFGFARLGAVDDANSLMREAATRLGQSANESHSWLLRLYLYRIDEAIRGNRHGGLVPEDVRVPNADEIQQLAGGVRNAQITMEGYTAWQFLSLSRVLDPEECTDPYAEWTRPSIQRLRTLVELRHFADVAEIEIAASTFLDADEAGNPDQRIGYWARAFPMIRRASPSLATRLIFAVPDVLRTPMPNQPSSDWRRHTLDLFQYAVEFVAGLTDAEEFPPLVEAGIALVRSETSTHAQCDSLARITWPCLQWFRKLNCAEESARFLYETRDLWPTTALLAHCPLPTRASGLRAHLAHAACQSYAGQPDELSRAIQFTVETVAAIRGRWERNDETEVAISLARAAALTPTDVAFSRLEELLNGLPQIGSTFTTAQYYSRLHFQIVEAIVLAFPPIGDF